VTQAISLGNETKARGFLARAIFPSIQVRFAVALLLTFFPRAIFYPLDYPAGELITLCCWLWVFPSRLGWLSLILAPMIPNSTYGYYAFNLLCLVATLAIAISAHNSTELHFKELSSLHRFAKGCMLVTLVLAAAQAATDPYIWMSIFPNTSLGSGRGAGLRSEPSQIASLIALYLVLVVARIEIARAQREEIHKQKSLTMEAMWVILATLALTRSLSVLIIVICFLPVLFIRRKNVLLRISALLAGGIVGIFFLGDRIRDGISTSGGSMTDLITESVGSWRNIPDLLILSNYRDCLLPGNPSEVRLKINAFAVSMSPALVWIKNTFSTFSAAGITVGLLVTAAIFFSGILIGFNSLSSHRPMRNSWLMLYLAAWLFMAKWDPSTWVALGLLLPMHGLNLQEPERCFAALSRESKPGHLVTNQKPAESGLPTQVTSSQYISRGARTGVFSELRSNYVNE
jgi:hypothetical protein